MKKTEKALIWIGIGIIVSILILASILIANNKNKTSFEDKCNCHAYYKTLFTIDSEQIPSFVQSELARDRLCTKYCIEEYY